jgi:hypothetical protein
LRGREVSEEEAEAEKWGTPQRKSSATKALAVIDATFTTTAVGWPLSFLITREVLVNSKKRCEEIPGRDEGTPSTFLDTVTRKESPFLTSTMALHRASASRISPRPSATNVRKASPSHEKWASNADFPKPGSENKYHAMRTPT